MAIETDAAPGRRATAGSGGPGDGHSLTLALRAAQAPLERYLWTPRDMVSFTPAVVSEAFGDGRALFAVTTVNNRPRYWVVRGCSSWRVDGDRDTPEGTEDFRDHVNEVLEAIATQFGSCDCYAMNARGDWVDEETGRFVPRAWTAYPVIDMDMGSLWRRLDWPDLPGVALAPHPFGRATVLAARQPRG